MKKEQQVVFSLLKEIDEICRKHKITYYLSPRLALCAVEGQPFPQNPQFGVVLMKVPDMECFRQITDEQLKDKRALESMKTHKWFPGFYLRYADTDTVCVNLDSYREYEEPGIGITILPLRAEIPSAMQRRKSTLEEAGWLQLCDAYGYHAPGGMKAKIARWLTRFWCLGGQKHLAEDLYNSFCKRNQREDTKKYILKRKRQTTVYAADIFDKTKNVTLEGHSFMVPAKTREYLIASYGKNYKDAKEPRYVLPTQTVYSARVSCGKFKQQAEDFEKHARQYRKYNRQLVKSSHLKDYFNECWEYVEFCGERMSLGIAYEKQKDYIRNLYKNEDYITLTKVFEPYYKMMDKSLAKGEIFAEDVEIFDIYVDTLEKTGKIRQRERISKLI